MDREDEILLNALMDYERGLIDDDELWSSPYEGEMDNFDNNETAIPPSAQSPFEIIILSDDEYDDSQEVIPPSPFSPKLFSDNETITPPPSSPFIEVISSDEEGARNAAPERLSGQRGTGEEQQQLFTNTSEYHQFNRKNRCPLHRRFDRMSAFAEIS
ncbi:hypothetical protein LOTGIDRAFT_165487 [Lottia gigantea]|uniref:Uncharacterized protein n=1 Tax=Lottia gigantea TaxID=225164 RepID=V4BIZ3_LOTGI|nr:hypothetical protein LOTGIDRAFT_165487 [Lottia gigantea]ESO88699.1 hypothetical protein LOTGIDRAFT_165487 [Lottia gigantea]